jgi:hypothetical protein
MPGLICISYHESSCVITCPYLPVWEEIDIYLEINFPNLKLEFGRYVDTSLGFPLVRFISASTYDGPTPKGVAWGLIEHLTRKNWEPFEVSREERNGSIYESFYLR